MTTTAETTSEVEMTSSEVSAEITVNYPDTIETRSVPAVPETASEAVETLPEAPEDPPATDSPAAPELSVHAAESADSTASLPSPDEESQSTDDSSETTDIGDIEEARRAQSLLMSQIANEALAAHHDDFDKLIQSAELKDLVLLEEAFALEVVNKTVIRKAQKLKKVFDTKYAEELKKLGDDIAGKEEIHKFSERFNLAYKRFNKRKAEFEKVEAEERAANSKAKNALINEIKEIVEKEDVGAHLRVKQLQEQWKSIGQALAEENEHLYQTFRMYLDRFFDLRGRYLDLIDLERKNNLEEKRKLLVELLEIVPDDDTPKTREFWITAAEKVRELNERWRAVGPVPRSVSDDIWSKFKQASDRFFELKRTFFESIDKEKEQNVVQKERIIARLVEMTAVETDDVETIKALGQEAKQLQEQWKQIGPAPQSVSKEIYNRYLEALNAFYDKRKEHFKEIDAEREEMLKKKLKICEEAETLKDSNDWLRTAERLKQLQRDWVILGEDMGKEANKLYKRFRKACDVFFDRKKEHYESLRKEEEQNLARKEALCAEAETFLADIASKSKEEAELFVGKFKEDFESIGQVPIKARDKIQARFLKIYNELLAALVKDPAEIEKLTLQNRYLSLLNQNQGLQKLISEEQSLRKKIRSIEDKIMQYENNILFISKSKSAEKMRADIEAMIAENKEEMRRLELKLKVLQSVRGTKRAEAPRA
jgi:hypothetical protein